MNARRDKVGVGQAIDDTVHRGQRHAQPGAALLCIGHREVGQRRGDANRYGLRGGGHAGQGRHGVDAEAERAGVGDGAWCGVGVKLAAIGDLEVKPGLAALGDDLAAVLRAGQVDPVAGGVLLPVGIEAQRRIDIQAERFVAAGSPADRGRKRDQAQWHADIGGQIGGGIKLAHIVQAGAVAVTGVDMAAGGVGHQADIHRWGSRGGADGRGLQKRQRGHVGLQRIGCAVAIAVARLAAWDGWRHIVFDAGAGPVVVVQADLAAAGQVDDHAVGQVAEVNRAAAVVVDGQHIAGLQAADVNVLLAGAGDIERGVARQTTGVDAAAAGVVERDRAAGICDAGVTAAGGCDGAATARIWDGGVATWHGGNDGAGAVGVGDGGHWRRGRGWGRVRCGCRGRRGCGGEVVAGLVADGHCAVAGGVLERVGIPAHAIRGRVAQVGGRVDDDLATAVDGDGGEHQHAVGHGFEINVGQVVRRCVQRLGKAHHDVGAT